MPVAIYLLPLAAAFLYPFGSLFLKRGMEEGSGIMRAMFVSNITMAACFLPLLLFANAPPDWHHVLWPLVTGAVFFLGQLFTVLAIRAGDVSVQAPLMGAKVIFVAVYSFFLKPDEVPALLWLAAALTAIAVFLLGGASLRRFRTAGKAIAFALVSCAFFGLTDTLVGYRSQAFGRLPFVVLMTSTFAALSLFLLPFCKGRLRSIPGKAWPGLLLGGLATGVQAVILNIGLTSFGQATLQNVIYSSRGLFGVLIVWCAGHLLGNRERHTAGAAVMRRRLAGSLLLCLAIGLVFL